VVGKKKKKKGEGGGQEKRKDKGTVGQETIRQNRNPHEIEAKGFTTAKGYRRGGTWGKVLKPVNPPLKTGGGAKHQRFLLTKIGAGSRQIPGWGWSREDWAGWLKGEGKKGGKDDGQTLSIPQAERGKKSGGQKRKGSLTTKSWEKSP